MKNILAVAIALFYSLGPLFGQTDDGGSKNLSIFDRLSKGMSEYKLDTTTAPDDKITRKIMELRELGGGFNITEAIEFKLAEEKSKKEIPAAQLAAFSTFITTGNGKKWLDNAPHTNSP